MPASLDSRDGLFYSATDILNFSETWKALYEPYQWQRSESIDSQAATNANKLSTNIVSNSKRDSNYFNNSNFTPNNHSTPNVKLNRKVTDMNDSSVEVMSFSTTHPDTSLTVENYREDSFNRSERYGSIVPSISREIDRSYRQKFSSKEIYCDRNKNRRLHKTGVKGIRCIVSFALTDDPVKKRTQIQACSISVMILAIVSISFVLVYFTNNKFPDVKVAVPSIPYNISKETPETNTSATLKQPEIESLINEVSSTMRTESTTEPSSDKAISEKNFVISQVILKIQNNIKAYPKFRRRSDLQNVTDSNLKEYVESSDVSEEFCSKCQKDVEVCILNEESGNPNCVNAVDRLDPTGCGGLCALETEACQLVDKIRGVRMCRIVSQLRCSALEWRCENGLCVNQSRRCDGRVDCYDRSDEMHCDCDMSKNFRCGHATSCFPNSALCNGRVDCWDGLDELNCTRECPEGEFTCTNGQCIERTRFCDGFADCADDSDEPHGCDMACGPNELRCDNARCVPRDVHCDGYDNCGDGTDELQCA